MPVTEFSPFFLKIERGRPNSLLLNGISEVDWVTLRKPAQLGTPNLEQMPKGSVGKPEHWRENTGM